MTKRFHITKPAFKAHYDIIEEGTNNSYYVSIKTNVFASDLPSLTLYPGSAPNDTILGVAHKPAFSETFKVAFGDPKSDNLVWEELQKTKVSRFEYSWTTYLSSGDSVVSDSEPRCNLIWKRTSHVAVEGSTILGWSPRNWKLVEEGKDEVLAVFTAEKGIVNCGTLEVRVSKGDDWDTKLLLTLICMYRRTQQGGG